MTIQIEFNQLAMDQLKSLYPKTKNWETKLKHYENAFNSELTINENLRDPSHIKLGLYLISSHRLANNGGYFSSKNIRVHSVIRDQIKAFQVITKGNNINKELTAIKLDTSMMTITDQQEQITNKILDSNDDEINQYQWVRELADDDAIKTLYRLFPDIKMNPEAYDGHELEVNLKSLSNYIVWLNQPTTTDKEKQKYINQAATILQVATLLSEDGITGVWPQKLKKSDFGRNYYTGMNIQNINKAMRRAILGESFQYDMRACAATWKFGYAKQLLIDNQINKTPELVFENTRQYIGTSAERNYLFQQIAKDVFENTVTEQEKQCMLKFVDDSDVYHDIKNNYLTVKEQTKLLKSAFTAIQFGARLTGNDIWPDSSKDNGYALGGLMDAIKSKTILKKFKENKIVKAFVNEQEILEEYIIEVETKKDPSLLSNELITKNGKIQNSKMLAYLFQHYETEIMDAAKDMMKRYESNNCKIIANIHDAVIVRTALKELNLVNIDLRKMFNNPLITLTAEAVHQFNTVPTNQEQIEDHKRFIKNEEQLTRGYVPQYCEIMKSEPKEPSLEEMMEEMFKFQEMA
jgi:hypothetical protein